MWIFPILLLLVQHSTGSILPMESPHEDTTISEERQSQCRKKFEEQNQQLTSLKAQLNVYRDKARELEMLLNYSNTIGERLWESYKAQTDFKQQVEKIQVQNSTNQLEEDQRQSFENRINELDWLLKNRDLKIKNIETQMKHKEDRTRGYLKTFMDIIEKELEGKSKEVLTRRLSRMLMFMEIKDPHLGY
ncbi:RING finger protein PFF0165c-like [Drosophila miranda]|uniref:RING finger protein PFF0165c-like n=1 Tax=Drosophila miranda TaxID=7229 RepID=UPI0007E800A0|nr:RING finger protein PFF0165c-like [Drosophila miranda]